MKIHTKKIVDQHSNFSSAWKNMLEDLLLYGLRAGADLIEIFLERSNSIGALSEQGIITNTNSHFGKGAGIRIFRGGFDSFFSTNDLSIEGLNYGLDKALSMVELSLPAQNLSHFPFQGLSDLTDYGAIKEDWLGACPSLSTSAQILLEANSHIQKQSKNTHICQGHFSRDWQEVMIAASDGTFVRDIRLHQSTILELMLTERNHQSSVARRYGTADNPADMYEWDAKASASEIYDSARVMLHAKPIEGGQMPIVIANSSGGVIFHEACGHLLETTQLVEGSTPFADSMGQKIAHESVTAVDEGISKRAFGSLSVDDEGMEPKSIVLIENGILKQFISDRSGERLTGHIRTGSGRREHYASSAASRMRNTYITAGIHTPSELIASVDKGLYCKSMGGGSVDSIGRFNFSVEEGYEIKNGQIGRPVKGATVLGDASTIMKRISMCANDLGLASGYCGSVSGNICVTVGQPHIKVDSITVGGT
uniref:Putative modulator of DNA gyrase; TldD n=1 Tax=Paulinella chromatophora TaxID=39717 RepID=B1X5N5_PAUCH|nr:putative modulator of DNA gyrase; TldD [Paulinella chromatophora]ACB43254.1 putative modulator of DNA gyrase; TldD [Paulinella chromatophora]